MFSSPNKDLLELRFCSISRHLPSESQKPFFAKQKSPGRKRNDRRKRKFFSMKNETGSTFETEIRRSSLLHQIRLKSVDATIRFVSKKRKRVEFEGKSRSIRFTVETGDVTERIESRSSARIVEFQKTLVLFDQRTNRFVAALLERENLFFIDSEEVKRTPRSQSAVRFKQKVSDDLKNFGSSIGHIELTPLNTTFQWKQRKKIERWFYSQRTSCKQLSSLRSGRQTRSLE